jgi:hypothetical protein
MSVELGGLFSAREIQAVCRGFNVEIEGVSSSDFRCVADGSLDGEMLRFE